MSRFCLVSVDLQLDFFDPDSEVGKLEKALCLPGVRHLIDHARANGRQIFHVATVHEESASMPLHLVKRNLPLYCSKDTDGAASIDGLVGGTDRRITKTKFSGFFETTLADEIAEYDSLILCGIATDCCVLATALDAASHGKHLYVPYQAVSASSLRTYLSGLEAIAKSAGAVVDLAAVLGQQGELWETRLPEDREMTQAEEWYKGEEQRLADFRKRQAASPTRPAQALVALLEEYLAGGDAP
jgi:nicotinamidase-related amidase